MTSDGGGPTGAELATAWLEHSPFGQMLGFELAALEPGRAVVTLPFRGELATAGDVVHGGAISALLDTASAMAAWSGHDPAQGARWGTVGMSVSFLAAARGVTLRAQAEVTRRTKSMCFCRAEATDPDGRTVAEALVTYRLG